MIDTELYLKRIGIGQSISPCLPDLNLLQKQHLLHVPFENLDVHTNTPISLEISRIYEKIILNNRGGFCYELNGLFYTLLQSLGFRVTIISGRVFHEGNYGPEYDHLAILVNLDKDKYIVDVGFGEFAFKPIKFELETEQEDERGLFYVDKMDNSYYRINKIENDESVVQYIFKEKPREFSEFESMCNFHQSSPKSHFSKKAFVSIPTEAGRVTLSNNLLKIKSFDSVEEREIDPKERKGILEKYFHFRN